MNNFLVTKAATRLFDNVDPSILSAKDGSGKIIPSQITAVLTTTIELKITTPDNATVALTITQEATRNLWHIKKYLDAYITHLQGGTNDEEFDDISKQYITKKNTLTKRELQICCSYLLQLLPDIDLDDLAMILNVDFEDITALAENKE